MSRFLLFFLCSLTALGQINISSKVSKAGDTMTGPLVIGGGTVTANTPVLDLSQTWNQGGVTFTGDVRNYTDMASSGSSLLVDWKLNGASVFKIDKVGTVQAYGGLYVGTTADTFVTRGAANTLDLRNGANAQTFQVYGTADAGLLNYRRLRATMSTGGTATISAEGLGTGVSGNTIRFDTGGSTRLTISTLITTSVSMSLGGQLTFGENINASFGTTSGTKLGISTSQKLGFWNATPIVQPSGTGETVGFTAGGGTTVTDASTFTGNVGETAYRISDIVKALKNSGLIAQ